MAASTLMMMRLSTAGIIVAPPCESNAYFLGPLKDSSPKKNVARKRKNPPTSQRLLPKKNAARKRKKSRSILEVSFPTEIRYSDNVDNLDDSDGGDS